MMESSAAASHPGLSVQIQRTLRRAPRLMRWQQGARTGLMLFKMRQNPPDHRRILDAGEHPHPPAAELADSTDRDMIVAS